MRLTLTSFLGLLLVAGCGDGEGGPNRYLRASIEGVLWGGEAAEGVFIFRGDSSVGHPLIATVATKRVGQASQSLLLELPYPVAPGTYALDGSTAYASWVQCPDEILADCAPLFTIASDPGTLTVTRTDATSGIIEGTFVFTGHFLGDPAGSTLPVTSGTFVVYAPVAFGLD